MSDRANRREDIIQAALNLFVRQGYNATSVRQIAEAVGVTEAALYYHFKDGKRELLGAVVETHLPDMLTVLEDASQADSLHDLVMRFGQGLVQFQATTRHVEKLRWAVSEFSTFTPDEREAVQEKQIIFQNRLREQVRRFVADDVTADGIAWVLMTVMFGYGQLFINLELAQVIEFSPGYLVDLVANLLSCAYDLKGH